MSTATLAVHAQPGARRNQVIEYSNGVLRIKIAAPPVEGKANKALIDYLAELLGLRVRQLTIIKGARSRDKVLRVEGMEQGELEAKLAQLAHEMESN